MEFGFNSCPSYESGEDAVTTTFREEGKGYEGKTFETRNMDLVRMGASLLLDPIPTTIRCAKMLQ